MSNEEKAREIAIEIQERIGTSPFSFDAIVEEIMEMAAWKDEQIEQLKCCYNCANWRDGLCDHVGGDVMADFVCDEWTMKGGDNEL